MRSVLASARANELPIVFIGGQLDRALAVARPSQAGLVQVNKTINHVWRGERNRSDDANRAAQRLMAGAPSRAQSLPWLHSTMLCVVDGDLAAAVEANKETLRLLEYWAVPEAPNYRTTMAIMIGRER